jgi:hypothetical protein
VADCRTSGEGLFVRAVRKRLRPRGLDVHLFDYDLIAEMHGVRQWPFPVPRAGQRARLDL